ncbi:MAG: DUF2752 domain-containing protein [Ruminococcus sp.]|nr:DUF2752 domain-containing protein [Ruminococcus sp.]
MPFLLIPLGLFAAKFVLVNITLPPCMMYEILGWYCPGCGSTRSVAALLKGDILLSLRESLLPMILIIVLLLLYVELVFRAFGKKFRSPVRNFYFLWGSLAFMLIYTVARNFIPAIAPIPLW